MSDNEEKIQIVSFSTNNTYYFEQNNIQMMKPKKYKFEGAA